MRRRLLPLLFLLLAPAAGWAEDRFVAPLPPEAEVEIRAALAYAEVEGGSLAFDLYLPARRAGPLPVVVFLNGIGAPWLRGHVQYTSWGRAVTARGLAGVTMDSRAGEVESDLRALLAHLQRHAAALGVDADRVALWSCSANVREGLRLGAALAGLRSAVVYYGSGELESFRRDRPLLVVRAGLDSAGLNRQLDALVARGLAQNAPLELLNVAGGVHGFDVRDPDAAARAAVRRTLDFLESTLTGDVVAAVAAGTGKAAAAAAVYGSDWEAAQRAYEALVGEQPGDPLLWESLGEARRARGDRAGAVAAWERALALGTPNRGRTSFAIATLQAEAGDLEGCLATLAGMKPWLRFFVAELRSAPVFAGLRADPRLSELLADVPPPPR
jgi:hypothetical protein